MKFNSAIFIGVVEDRNDPLRLGRCRVRVTGLHTDNVSELPTDDLPWSIPVQPVNSAGVSGIGTSPTGLVEGSWVVVTFFDQDMQKPVILGSLSGYNVGGNEPVTGVVDETFEKLPTQAEFEGITISNEEKYLGTLTKSDFIKLREKLKQRESSGDNKAINSLGYVGWYQFGMAALEDIGYVIRGSWSKYRSNQTLSLDDVWTGKNGCSSRENFLNNKDAQDNAFFLNTQLNYQRLRDSGSIPENIDRQKLAGLLAVAHNQGHVAAKKHLRGVVGKDGNGVTTTEYFIIGYSSLYEARTNEYPNKDNLSDPAIDSSTVTRLGAEKYDVSSSPVVLSRAFQNKEGFKDPNGVYPKKDWEGESDIHRLARNQKISETIVSSKEAEHKKNIAIAMSSETWSQPTVPYNAIYPYNHVVATESGHVFEMDDTDGCERINLHHTSGSFLEIDNNGSQTNRIIGHGCTIIEKDGIVYVEGNAHVHCVGNVTIYAGQDVYIESMGNINMKGKNINLQAEQSINLSAPDIGVDVSNPSGYHINSGFTIPNISTMQFNGEHQQLFVKSRSEDDVVALEGTENAAASLSVDQAYDAPQGSRTLAASDFIVKPVVAVPCDFRGQLSLNTQLSTNYKLSDLTKSRYGIWTGDSQHGLSPQEIACNLKHLAVNVAEELRGKYSSDGFTITSAFRNANSGLVKPSSGRISQHELGQALDFVCVNHRGRKTSRAEHFRIAQEIRSLIPFDQIILEYTSAGLVWVHVSFNIQKQRKQVFTYNNHNLVGEGLILVG